MWGSMSPEEQTEAFETLQAEEKEMRSNGTLATKAMALYGAGVTHDLSLEGIMGLLGSALKSRNKEFSDLRAKLKDDGKNNIDADHIIKDHYDAELKSETLLASNVLLINLLIFQFRPTLLICWSHWLIVKRQRRKIYLQE